MKRLYCILLAVLLLCLYSVNALAADSAYSLSLSPDKRIKLEETTDVVLTLSSQSETSYNAYYFILTYDAQKLRFVSASGNSQVKDDHGTLTVLRFGDSIPLTTPITVKFAAQNYGQAKVTVREAYADSMANASERDIPPAAIADDGIAVITIGKTNEPVDWDDSDDDKVPQTNDIPKKPENQGSENPYTGDSIPTMAYFPVVISGLFILIYTLAVRQRENKIQNN